MKNNLFFLQFLHFLFSYKSLGKDFALLQNGTFNNLWTTKLLWQKKILIKEVFK